MLLSKKVFERELGYRDSQLAELRNNYYMLMEKYSRLLSHLELKEDRIEAHTVLKPVTGLGDKK